MGQFGLECKSLVCRWISIDGNGNSTDYDPEYEGAWVVIVMFVLTFFLNLASYIKIRVIEKYTKTMYKYKMFL